MNANELADEFKEENNDWNEDNLRHWGKQTEAMLRKQQAQIVLIEKNADYWADKHSELIKEYYKQQAEIGALETDNNQLRKEAQEHALEYLSVCGQADEHYEKARQQQAEIEVLKADNQKAYAYIAKLANDMGKTKQ